MSVAGIAEKMPTPADAGSVRSADLLLTEKMFLLITNVGYEGERYREFD